MLTGKKNKKNNKHHCKTSIRFTQNIKNDYIMQEYGVITILGTLFINLSVILLNDFSIDNPLLELALY